MRRLRPLALVLAMLLTSSALAQPMVTDSSGGSRPNPDPTVLGTAALDKALGALRELISSRLDAEHADLERVKAQLDRTDARLIKRLDEVQISIDAAISHSQTLTNEKFKGVDQQFQGRDVALAAALLAQKTSVDEQNKANAASSAKQEGAITKQIDGISSIIASNSKGTDDKIDGVKALFANQAKGVDDKIADLRNTINDLRTSVVQIQSRGAGQSDLYGYVIGGAGVLIACFMLVYRASHSPPPPPPPPPPPQYYAQNYPQPQPQPQVSVVPVVPVPVQPQR